MQNAILEVGRAEPQKYVRVSNDRRPTPINHPMKITAPIGYFPDATYELKNGRSYIFEVMDSEKERQALVVAHIVEASLARLVRKVFFIVPSKKDQDKVEHIANVVLANLEDLSNRVIGRGVDFYYLIVSRKDARSYGKTRGIIAKALDQTQGRPKL